MPPVADVFMAELSERKRERAESGGGGREKKKKKLKKKRISWDLFVVLLELNYLAGGWLFEWEFGLVWFGLVFSSVRLNSVQSRIEMR